MTARLGYLRSAKAGGGTVRPGDQLESKTAATVLAIGKA